MGTSDEELLAQAVGGDEDALSTLLEIHGARVRKELRIAPKWQQVVDADDVMQVTYVEAFLGISRFKPGSPGSFPAWLKQIAEHNLRDAIRELERDKRPHPDKRIESPPSDESFVNLFEVLGGTSSTPSRSAARHEIKQLVVEAVKRLPTDYATAVRLYDLEGRTGPAVAAEMGRSHGAVKMLIARAHDRLRELLGSGSQFFSDRT